MKTIGQSAEPQQNKTKASYACDRSIGYHALEPAYVASVASYSM